MASKDAMPSPAARPLSQKEIDRNLDQYVEGRDLNSLKAADPKPKDK